MKFSIKLFAIFCTLFIFSCSSDDESNALPASNNTIETSINEKPSSGDVVTTITSNLTGDLTFSLTSESISNAFTMDSNSGELRVAAWQVFDYEVNPVITATVNISNGSEFENKAIAVNINNLDDIWLFLNTSRSNYENAANGQWIAITQSEYNDLANYLYDVNKCGSTDTQYNNNNQIYYDSDYYTYANNNGAVIESDNYLFAMKYTCNKDNLTNSKVKVSMTVDEGYQNVGSNLPEHDSGENYFVIKGGTSSNAETMYMAVTAEGFGYFNSGSGLNFRYDLYDVNELPYSWAGIARYQGLSTTVKQWD
jgi:hypothetical protein